MSNLNSRRASKNKPCKICGEANGWCLHLDSIDGMLCMKHELPGCERKKLKNGEIGFQYGPSYFNDGKPVKQYIQAPKKEVQTLEVCFVLFWSVCWVVFVQQVIVLTGVEVVEQWNFNIYIRNHLATAATRAQFNTARNNSASTIEKPCVTVPDFSKYVAMRFMRR